MWNNNRVHAIYYIYIFPPLKYLDTSRSFKWWRVFTTVPSMMPMQPRKWGFRILKCRLSFSCSRRTLCLIIPLMMKLWRKYHHTKMNVAHSNEMVYITTLVCFMHIMKLSKNCSSVSFIDLSDVRCEPPKSLAVWIEAPFLVKKKKSWLVLDWFN